MTFLIICKASTVIGLGHLMRARTFAEKVIQTNIEIDVDFVVIGDVRLQKLSSSLKCKVSFFEKEESLSGTENCYDVVFFDATEFEEETVKNLKKRAGLTVSISPIFNQMNLMDLLFTRTKYLGDFLRPEGLKIFCGLDYTIVQPDCFKIDTTYFTANLSKSTFHLAISMGGGDAANKSLDVVKTLKGLSVPATIWVMLGEGYKHSYDDFIEAVERDSGHEVILAKTNKSLWNILNNCNLLITTSGVTSYEAAYAGLPSIVYYDIPSQFYLIRELIENEVSINGGIFDQKNLDRLNLIIEELYHNKRRLVEMHKRGARLIDGMASYKIIEIVTNEFKQKKSQHEQPILLRRP